jgi:hypothetical protein
LGVTNPLNTCNKVDLPEPLPPSITNFCFGVISRSMPLKIHSLLNFLPRFFMEIVVDNESLLLMVNSR